MLPFVGEWCSWLFDGVVVVEKLLVVVVDLPLGLALVVVFAGGVGFGGEQMRARKALLRLAPVRSSRAAPPEGADLPRRYIRRTLANALPQHAALGEAAGRGLRPGAFRVGAARCTTTELPNYIVPAIQRHRRERVHRRRDARGAWPRWQACSRGRFHLHGRHALRVGAEHLVPHAELRLPHPYQRRDGFSLHLWRARRPRPILREAGWEARLRRLVRRHPRRPKLRRRRPKPSDRLHGRTTSDGRERQRAELPAAAKVQRDRARSLRCWTRSPIARSAAAATRSSRTGMSSAPASATAARCRWRSSSTACRSRSQDDRRRWRGRAI